MELVYFGENNEEIMASCGKCREILTINKKLIVNIHLDFRSGITCTCGQEYFGITKVNSQDPDRNKNLANKEELNHKELYNKGSNNLTKPVIKQNTIEKKKKKIFDDSATWVSIVAAILFVIVKYVINDSHEAQTQPQPQPQTQTQNPTANNLEPQNDPKLLEAVEETVSNFMVANYVEASKYMVVEIRVLNSKENPAKIFEELGRLVLRTMMADSQVTGLPLNPTYRITNLRSVDQNNVVATVYIESSSKNVQIPFDMTVKKINGIWKVDYESFIIPITQRLN